METYLKLFWKQKYFEIKMAEFPVQIQKQWISSQTKFNPYNLKCGQIANSQNRIYKPLNNSGIQFVCRTFHRNSNNIVINCKNNEISASDLTTEFQIN